MRRTYNFKNGTITINNSYNYKNIVQSTELFMKKVLKEKNQNGNRIKTRTIKEK